MDMEINGVDRALNFEPAIQGLDSRYAVCLPRDLCWIIYKTFADIS